LPKTGEAPLKISDDCENSHCDLQPKAPDIHFEDPIVDPDFCNKGGYAAFDYNYDGKAIFQYLKIGHKDIQSVIINP